MVPCLRDYLHHTVSIEMNHEFSGERMNFSIQKHFQICFRTLFIKQILVRLCILLWTPSIESLLLSMIFRANCRVVLWKTAPFIVLIKTIDQNSSNFVRNIVLLEISLNFVEKHWKVVKKYWSSFAFFFHSITCRFYVCVMTDKFNFKSSVMCVGGNVTHVWMVPTGLFLGEEWQEERNT